MVLVRLAKVSLEQLTEMLSDSRRRTS